MKKILAIAAMFSLIACTEPTNPSSELDNISSPVLNKSSQVQYSSVTYQSSSSMIVVQSYPIDVTVSYEASSEQQYGRYYINYKINNYSMIPVKILSAQYAIYGSNGGILNDVVVTRDNLEYAWMAAQTYQLNRFEGYSAGYVPYSFQFLINFVDASGKTKAVTFSGIFKVFSSRKIPGALPPADTASKATPL